MKGSSETVAKTSATTQKTIITHTQTEFQIAQRTRAAAFEAQGFSDMILIQARSDNDQDSTFLYLWEPNARPPF